MEFINSVISFLIVFIPISILLQKIFRYFSRKYAMFKYTHHIIKKSKKEKVISNIGWIITVILFYIISNFFNFNDYQGGLICAIINSFILTILEPEKDFYLDE